MWDVLWVFYTPLRMRLIHFPYEIFLIWTSFCPTFIYYFGKTLNAVANSSFQSIIYEIAQPQVCYPNPKQDMLNLKSSMCRKVSNVAKTTPDVNITGKELFESIGSVSAHVPPRSFTFTNTQVNSGSKTTSKSSIPKPISPTSSSTKAVPKQPKSTN